MANNSFLKNLLIIGHTFPEPATTAAGSRMMQLIKMFDEEGYKITFVSTAQVSDKSEDLELLGIKSQTVLLNDSSFDSFIKKEAPSIVIFDRFITEEQFGWRVAEQCPNTLKVLDTEDLHFLRKARQEAVKNKIDVKNSYLFSETAKREIASILRCDISLIISEFEINLLKKTFKIDGSLLFYLPFLVASVSDSKKENLPNYDTRKDFLSIGNFLHAPNLDSVIQLKKEIWPLIKKQLPEANLHVYGAYAPQQVLEFHNEKEGFLIKGWIKNADDAIKNTRVCLAPLRFGAGLKGKIIDSMKNGTPCVTTPIGGEGMQYEFVFSGSIVNTYKEFVKSSVEMYSHKNTWKEAQNNGFIILEKKFDILYFSEKLLKYIKNLQANLKNHREVNFIGQLIQHNSIQSRKYLSKWIEEKNKI